MNPTERKVWSIGGIFIGSSLTSRPEKFAALFSFFSSKNFFFSTSVDVYPNPKRSFFYFIAIGLTLPYSFLPKPNPTRAPFPTTCLRPDLVVLDNRGTGIFYPSPINVASTNSRDLKEHSSAFSFTFT